MPNIIGEGFREYVVDQIKTRERTYGQSTRDTQTQSYLNSKTGWVCMVSGVDIDDINFVKGSSYQGLNVGGSNLAEEYVLFNGTYDADNVGTLTNSRNQRQEINRSRQRAGIVRNGSILNNGAYGLGGLEFGLRPMPGITSVRITSGPRGSLRFAEVKIKAWNRAQFEAIDILYMRLGYTVLVEFGHSNFYYNNGKYEENNPWTLSDSFLKGANLLGDVKSESGDKVVVPAGKALGQYDVLALIRHLRKASNGNYDAVYGKVANFDWSYAKDGSFDISVKVVSMGDVIESLKLNTMSTPMSLATGSAAPATAEQTPQTSAEVIESYANKHDIGKMLNQVRQDLDTKGSDGIGFSKYVQYGASKDSTGKKLVDAVKQEYEGTDSKYYMRLGSFLQWYQVNKMVVVRDDQPLLSLDYDTDSNLVFWPYGQRSCDPSVCVLHVEYSLNGGGTRIYAPSAEPYTVDPKKGPGKIMNVYLNFEFILTTLDSSMDDEGNVGLLDFLEKILSGICEATGNANKLSIAIDEEENVVRIIDEVKLPDRDQIIEKLKPGQKATTLALFTMYGFRNETNSKGEVVANRGSFIKDFNIQTGFSKETAAMIAIGAQANGQVVGEDATAFSAWSRGLRDRIEPSKLDKAVSKETDAYDATFAEELKRFNQYLSDISNGAGGVYKPKWSPDDISTWSSFQRSYLKWKIGENARKYNVASNTIGFLPINLSLTMEGLSGMKVYQKFAVDSAFLPSNYPTALEFIVKSIAHTIEGNVWTTTIESLVVPNSIPKTGEMGYLREVPGTNGAQAGTGGGAAPNTTDQQVTVGTIPARGNDTQAAVDAFITAINHTFGTPSPETKRRCASYTGNIAANFAQALKGKITRPRGAVTPTEGNANDAGYRAFLTKQGYTGTYIGSFTGAQLAKELAKPQFNVGDVAIYYRGNEKFHAQIYQKGYVTPGHNWTCDRKNNYGVNFVYGGATYNNKVFDFWIYKAPLPDPRAQVAATTTVPKTTSGLTATQAAAKIKEYGEAALIVTNKAKVQLTSTTTDTNWPEYPPGKVYITYENKGAVARLDTDKGSYTPYIKALGSDYVQFPLNADYDSDPIVVKIKVVDIEKITNG